MSGLTPGDYYLMEVTAPYGYAIDPEPIHFEILSDVDAKPVTIVAKNERLASPPVTPRPTLPPWGPPQTGDAGLGALGLVMALSGTGFAGALTALLMNLKKGAKEQTGM